jgi:hypothetical protein
LAKTVRSGPKNGPHFCAPDRTGLDRGQPREEVKQARREAQGTADAETTASMAWRQASLALWADKTQLLRAASRARQQEDEEDESSATPATPDP